MDLRLITALFFCALIGCSAQSPVDANNHAATLGERPAALRDAKVSRGGVLCPIEKLNGEGVRQLPALRAGSVVTLSGWATVADAANPTPPLVHLVLRPRGSSGSADAFLPGQREARTDLAATNPRIRNAGFVVTARLPSVPGRYDVLLWTGSEDAQVECDTHARLELQ